MPIMHRRQPKSETLRKCYLNHNNFIISVIHRLTSHNFPQRTDSRYYLCMWNTINWILLSNIYHCLYWIGKTHYIRYLIQEVEDKTLIYVPLDIAKQNLNTFISPFSYGTSKCNSYYWRCRKYYQRSMV